MCLVAADTAFLRAATAHLGLLFALLGLGLGFLSGPVPPRVLILLSSAACSLCFSLHSYDLGSPTGMGTTVIGLVQNLLATRFGTAAGRPAWLAPVFALTCLLAATLALHRGQLAIHIPNRAAPDGRNGLWLGQPKPVRRLRLRPHLDRPGVAGFTSAAQCEHGLRWST